MKSRWLAAGGLIGPASFITAWAILGSRRADYSPVADAISELARTGTSTRPLMTAGMFGFAVGVTAFSVAVDDQINRKAAVAALTNGIATAGVALTPLGSSVESFHFVFAGVAYISLALLPVAAASSFSKPIRTASFLTGTAAAASLLTSVVGDTNTHGFWQRAGLTVADVWIVAVAIRLLRR